MATAKTDRIELELGDKGNLVESLWRIVNGASQDLETLPGTVQRIIETEAWRDREYRGKRFHHDRFVDFITTKPLAGCGWPLEKVEALIKDEPETLAMWREATTGKPGGDRQSDEVKSIHDNIINGSVQGTSKAYTLDRLKRERPDLYKRVVAGELSANAAAKEAGWRKEQSPLSKLRSAWKAASLEERENFLAEIS